MYKNSSNKR